MKVIKKDVDSTKVVKCTEFVKGDAKWDSMIIILIIAIMFLAYYYAKDDYYNNKQEFIVVEGVIEKSAVVNRCYFGVYYIDGHYLIGINGKPIQCKTVFMTGKQSGIEF